jgi:hypothetical protein
MAQAILFHDESPAGAIHPAASLSSSLADVVSTRSGLAGGQPGVSGAKPGFGAPTTGETPVAYRPVGAKLLPTGYNPSSAPGAPPSTATTGPATGSSSTTTQSTTNGTPDDDIDLLAELAQGLEGGGTGGEGDVAVPIQSDTTDEGDGGGQPAASGGGGTSLFKIGLVIGFFLALGAIAWKFRDKILPKHGGAAK